MLSPLNAASFSSTASGATGAQSSGGADLGRDAFLQLLVAQLQNQDPTSPQEGHEFAAQLAQFSSVEQLAELNTTLGSQGSQLAELAGALGELQNSQNAMTAQLTERMNLQSATALVGREVRVEDPHLDWSGTGSASFEIHLATDAREVEIAIRDASGEIVRTIRTDSTAAGTHGLEWDGATTDGSAAAEGAYTLEVTAIGTDGEPVGASPTARGLVDRITVDAGGVFLWVGGRPIPFTALQSLEPGTPQPPFRTPNLPPMP